MSRRRAKAAKFAPLPTLSEDDSEPYRYLATRPAKTSYGRGPFYPGSTSSNPTSPARSSTYGGASPAHSPGAQSLRFDPYGHGPFYPGTPPASPNAQVSSPRTPLPPSPLSPSFRSSQSTLYVSSPVAYRNVALSPLPLRNDHLRGSESSSTLSRATSTIPGIDTAVTSP
ncbi:hypothetical protein B0H19DRAFT_1096821 [Mycena capillaripes]|nr:hypothetical protein B0H19DRAFT_1096821 [Mycena capillaripes]